MKKEIYGCACCTPEFGEIFKGNRNVGELSAMKPAEVKVDRIQNIRVEKIDRRSFLKGSIVAAGSVALVPGLAACTITSQEELEEAAQDHRLDRVRRVAGQHRDERRDRARIVDGLAPRRCLGRHQRTVFA